MSDVGLVRPDNQDCHFVDGARKVFCVADGMGGRKGGAIASRMVCEAVARVATIRGVDARIAAVNDAISSANVQIQKYAANAGYPGMGTTVVAMLIDPANPREVAIAHVGDSRVYRRRSRRLERLTEDHRRSPLSSFLTRAVGVLPNVHPDWLRTTACKGDVWLICCDGVTDMLPDSTINGILAKGGSAKEMVQRLSDAVRRAGARDNYTMIVVKT